jgi:hypothetical protein
MEEDINRLGGRGTKDEGGYRGFGRSPKRYCTGDPRRYGGQMPRPRINNNKERLFK